jgi:hypothetical protein
MEISNCQTIDRRLKLISDFRDVLNFDAYYCTGGSPLFFMGSFIQGGDE